MKTHKTFRSRIFEYNLKSLTEIQKYPIFLILGLDKEATWYTDIILPKNVQVFREEQRGRKKLKRWLGDSLLAGEILLLKTIISFSFQEYETAEDILDE